MRLVSFRHADKAKIGAVVEGGIVDLSSRWTSLREAIAAKALGDLAAAAKGESPSLKLEEVELAVVIGERCRHVPRASALSVVAGYTCFLDGSVRDFQKHSVTAGKNFPATGPLGPSLVT